jgi:HK97 family phage major capsid protein
MAVTGVSGLGAAFTPQEAGKFYLDALVAQSIFLQSGVRVVRTDKESLSIPRLLADAAANWTNEGAAITLSDPNGDAVVAIPRKLAALTTVDNETLDDSEPSVLDVLGLSLARACALKFDLGAFFGTGAAPQILGLAGVSGIQTVSSGTNGLTPASLDVFADAIGALDASNASASVICMHPRTWKTLSKIKETTTSVKPVLVDGAGSPVEGLKRSIYGVPVLTSSQFPIAETQGTSSDCSSAFVYDASQILAVLRKDASVEVDRSVLFGSDQSQVRVILRADVVVAQPSAVVRITGIRP